MRQKTTKKSMPVKQQAFLKHFAAAELRFNISEACKKAGVSRATVYRWLAADSAFKEAFGEIQETRFDEIEAALHKKAVTDCDTTALIFLCKTLLKKRGYIESSKTNIPESNPILEEVIAELIKEEISLENAVLKLTKSGIRLPRALEIMLARKTEEEPERFNAGTTLEELEQKAQAAYEATLEQREHFLPTRREEVAALKKSLGVDTFNTE